MSLWARLRCAVGWHAYRTTGHVRGTFLTDGGQVLEAYEARAQQCRHCQATRWAL